MIEVAAAVTAKMVMVVEGMVMTVAVGNDSGSW
jgi:hypothetical protein